MSSPRLVIQIGHALSLTPLLFCLMHNHFQTEHFLCWLDFFMNLCVCREAINDDKSRSFSALSTWCTKDVTKVVQLHSRATLWSKVVIARCHPPIVEIF